MLKSKTPTSLSKGKRAKDLEHINKTVSGDSGFYLRNSGSTYTPNPPVSSGRKKIDGDLLSNCCASDFDGWGYEKEEGIWQERCEECGKLCEPLWISARDIINIRNCVKWNKENK